MVTSVESVKSVTAAKSVTPVKSEKSVKSVKSVTSAKSVTSVTSGKWVKWVNWWRARLSPVPRLQLEPDALPVPWHAARVAIFKRIAAGERRIDGSLRDAIFPLADAAPQLASLDDGATDYTLAYPRAALERAQLQDVCSALRRAADDHTAPYLLTMYQALLTAGDATMGDDLLARLDDSAADPARTALLARWLAREAPDAAAVKLAIVLLGRYGSASDADLLLTLGLHEAFTQLCAIALVKLLGPEQAQTAMWNLARRVHGWGRVHVVRQLAGTQCPEIRQWLLRDGYKNTLSNAYLAYHCATGGKLLAALQAAPADERLLIGAGEMIVALLEGRDGPGKSMADYAEGAAATLALLTSVQRQRPQLLPLAASIIAIAERNYGGWDEAQLRHIQHMAKQILAFDYWPAAVLDKLRFGSDDEFELAATLAKAFHIDAWEYRFAKQQRRERSQWFGLTDTADPTRAKRYIALAIEQLDLAALELGIAAIEPRAKDVEMHAAINWLAIGLRNFPGQGWPILRAALTGADWANKGNALDTLARWRPAHWHADAGAVLEHAWRTESDLRLKQDMARLMEKSRARE